MSAAKEWPTQANLLSELRYCAGSGALLWRGRLGRQSPAGCVRSWRGYLSLVVRFEGVLYQAHRIAWAMHYGEWPVRNIAHVNGDSLDNRISNLQLCGEAKQKWEPAKKFLPREVPTFGDISSVLKYEAETGLLYWKVRRSGTRGIWSVAGHTDRDGYLSVSVGGRTFKAHRVAWLLHYRKWPDDQIDHIDGIRTNNRIENLRVVSSLENGRNQKMRESNKLRVFGIKHNEGSGTYSAFIGDRGRTLYLGTFFDLESAMERRVGAEKRLGYHPNHGRK